MQSTLWSARTTLFSTYHHHTQSLCTLKPAVGNSEQRLRHTLIHRREPYQPTHVWVVEDGNEQAAFLRFASADEDYTARRVTFFDDSRNSSIVSRRTRSVSFIHGSQIIAFSKKSECLREANSVTSWESTCRVPIQCNILLANKGQSSLVSSRRR